MEDADPAARDSRGAAFGSVHRLLVRPAAGDQEHLPGVPGRHPFIATYLAGLGFGGALVGSVSRALTAIAGVSERSFPLFLGSYMLIFLLAGMGNGSTYRMIPSIFAALGRREAVEKGCDPRVEFKRRAAAVIGIAGAIGAFGRLPDPGHPAASKPWGLLAHQRGGDAG